ncbi:hypothetical protein LAJ19_17685 (plasmid) [Deinococcus taeanensis]|uniref:four-carbon acid sugar kinase family protein n=1 Tax=Deinococcus taeanensis TaxID=2737050 RepID=UPI001CDB861C|nr:four-carbon acid sugar kinase family protein [Deinococcus taeanensis]UBV44604.1 hypothetical protein LAJ19_17685 [Deinococcus taeanensis]
MSRAPLGVAGRQPPGWLTGPFPAADPTLLPRIRDLSGTRRLVVLDDDPTGMQTLYDLPVVLQWQGSEIRDALGQPWPAVYILTNSRSMNAADATRAVQDVMRQLVQVGQELRLDLRVVSRSDSTLRGHYPLETDIMAEELAGTQPVTGTLLLPAFIEGGRVTAGGVHYLVENGQSVPVGETEFARDPAFMYRSSALPDWVAEKTAGRVPAEAVHVLTLETIRQGGPEAVAEWLCGLPAPFVAVADATCQQDIEVVALGTLLAERSGVNVLSRTAASMVRALAGLAEQAPLRPEALLSPRSRAGGLCVVGSFISRSSEQLAQLLARPGVQATELNVARILAGDGPDEIARTASAVNAHLAAVRDVVLYTSRHLHTGASGDANLDIGRAVSTALTDVVRRLEVEPSFVIAKGGITSHNVALRGLGVHVAQVRGQALPGVPVWTLGAETPFPGLPYIVFPGNVGGPGSLGELHGALHAARQQGTHPAAGGVAAP